MKTLNTKNKTKVKNQVSKPCIIKKESWSGNSFTEHYGGLSDDDKKSLFQKIRMLEISSHYLRADEPCVRTINELIDIIELVGFRVTGNQNLETHYIPFK